MKLEIYMYIERDCQLHNFRVHIHVYIEELNMKMKKLVSNKLSPIASLQP